MGIYVNVRCGDCGKSITGGYTADYYAIGSPIIMCDKCGTVNSHSDKCTEWSIMSSARKSSFVVRAALSSLFWAIGIFFLTLLASIAVTDDMSVGMMAFAAVAAFLLSAGYRIIQVRRLIRESDDRMGDPTYRSQLRQAGLF